jgi:hypothetical protein
MSILANTMLQTSSLYGQQTSPHRAFATHGLECCKLRGLPLLSGHDVQENQSGKEAADRAGRRSDKRLKILRTKVVYRLLAAYC